MLQGIVFLLAHCISYQPLQVKDRLFPRVLEVKQIVPIYRVISCSLFKNDEIYPLEILFALLK